MEMSTPEHTVANSPLHPAAETPTQRSSEGKMKKYGSLPPDADAHLGKVSDTALGRRYGVSHGCVRDRRRKLGIAPYASKSVESSVPEAAIPLLGTRPDADIVKEFGVSTAAVFRARKNLGITRYRIEMGTYTKTTQSKSAKLPAEAFDDFGKMSDVDVGKKYGVNRHVVAYHRRQRGIAAFNPASTND
jgi:hypothetical protein